MIKALAIIIAAALGGCCSMVISSEETFYRGRVINGNDSIEVYADNLNRGVFRSGISGPIGIPVQPDSNGFFLVTGTTPSHDDCGSPPKHWENGPLEIYIRGPHIEDYRDTIWVSELKDLPRMRPDSLGIKLGNQEIGVWQLPDIVLKLKS
jgi:hypothetical protein